MKYRIWLKKDKRFLLENEFEAEKIYLTHDGELVYCYAEKVNPRLSIVVTSYMDDDEYEINEYTGLEDKDSKEIYEGDIILSDNPYTDKVLVNDRNNFVYDAIYSESHSDLYGFSKYMIKIIGNIYENPELLEDE